MKFRCPECRTFDFKLTGKRFSSFVLVACANCGEPVAEMQRTNFLEDEKEK